MTAARNGHTRMNLRVIGVVQGVGFRPFAHRLATGLGLRGWILNDPGGVTLELEGVHATLLEFLARLQREKPRAAILYAVEPRFLAPVGYRGFEIRKSEGTGPARAWLLPDLGLCEDCARELLDPADRRHRYPFLNCTNCGPRYTILDALPYDRAMTSMKDFVMCPDCRSEYEDPLDRRFHAQPTACGRCGPRLTAVDPAVASVSEGDEALRKAIAWIDEGRIVAVKGLGGYHLIVDALNQAALVELRRRKRRAAKPFALMVSSVQQAMRWVQIEPFVEAQLESAQAPIVLAPRTAAGWSEPAQAVAPDCPQLGVFLPYTPLHRLILEELGRPVVATSGNPTDQPTIHDDAEAMAALAGICDVFLVHDRPIRRQADDSVVQVLTRPEPRPQLLRRARGFAPLPLLAPRDLPVILGVGGHMNVTVGLSRGREIVLSPHLGEMGTASGQDACRRTIDDLMRLMQVEPDLIVHDAHPDYFTTALAEELALEWRVPSMSVQHHHAHMAAAALEHELEGEFSALAWDGTGAGGDGTVWGGELLVGDAGRSERRASLVAFSLAGGELAVHEAWRSAWSLLQTAFDGEIPSGIEVVAPAPAEVVAGVRELLRAGGRCVQTTSMGRLFDGVSALLGICAVNTHQAQAPQMLEWAATGWSGAVPAWPVEVVCDDSLTRLDWRPMVRGMVEARAASGEPAMLAAAFHDWLIRGALQLIDSGAPGPVVLTGGVFCNRFLSEGLLERAGKRDLRVHSMLPPTDGALAAGQIWAAAHR